MSKEIPLLFTKENRGLVRRGLKTETRREMKSHPPSLVLPCPPGMEKPEGITLDLRLEPRGNNWVVDDASWAALRTWYRMGDEPAFVYRSPYGCPQNEPVRYWMREPVRILGIYEGVPTSPLPWVELIYLDDGEDSTEQACEISVDDYKRLMARKDYKRPTTALHMLRSFTRTWLPGVCVWPEKLGDMSEESAIAEGIARFDELPSIHPWGNDARWGFLGNPPPSTEHCLGTAKHAYGNLWNSVNGPGSWQPDKWAWAIRFEPPA